MVAGDRQSKEQKLLASIKVLNELNHKVSAVK